MRFYAINFTSFGVFEVLKARTANMGFARCGVEGNPRDIIENTRKKLFHFLVFS